jgi:hypothetical protein
MAVDHNLLQYRPSFVGNNFEDVYAIFGGGGDSLDQGSELLGCIKILVVCLLPCESRYKPTEPFFSRRPMTYCSTGLGALSFRFFFMSGKVSHRVEVDADGVGAPEFERDNGAERARERIESPPNRRGLGRA